MRRQPGRVRELGRTPHRRTTWVVVALALAVSGCAGGAERRACTLIGTTAGVFVAISPLLFLAGSPVRLTLCADDACRSKPVVRSHAESTLVPNSRLGPDHVRVKVTIVRQSRTIFRDSMTVRTHKFQLNGPGCGPPVYNARVIAHADGTLAA